MEEEMSNRRVSNRTRKVATKMAAALTSNDNRTQAAIARLEALENDNGAIEVVDMNDDDEASLDEDDDLGYVQKKQHKGSKRKTRQAKALEARRAPKSFLELLQELLDLRVRLLVVISARFVVTLQATIVVYVG
ncbi:Zinc finger HIT-type [Arabidopsis suecica]|uniref:Zinc finger HIT-type n=1 Tax=Arabidopsis suecica TaxID=45249 RepID=A0A8T1YQ57_ARASU|nr:Zinc finger HIT-type [Arabidopsis suecica]